MNQLKKLNLGHSTEQEFNCFYDSINDCVIIPLGVV